MPYRRWWQRKKGITQTHSSNLPRTISVNTTFPEFPSCVLPHTSAINNSPRAVVWLAGRIVCNSRARPASKSLRERITKLSIVPATGLHSESKTVSEGYLQSKDLQRDLFSISCLPCRHAPKVAFCSDGRRILLRAVVSANPKACHPNRPISQRDVIPNRAESPVRNLLFGSVALSCRFPKRSSCGKHLEILWEAPIDRILHTTVCL
jgi:hypothetical protein